MSQQKQIEAIAVVSKALRQVVEAGQKGLDQFEAMLGQARRGEVGYTELLERRITTLERQVAAQTNVLADFIDLQLRLAGLDEDEPATRHLRVVREAESPPAGNDGDSA